MRIICVVSAAHDVPQVELLGGPTTPESGLCVGPQHQILVGGHAGCSVAPCSSSAGYLSLNKNGHSFKQNEVDL